MWGKAILQNLVPFKLVGDIVSSGKCCLALQQTLLILNSDSIGDDLIVMILDLVDRGYNTKVGTWITPAVAIIIIPLPPLTYIKG